VVCPEVQAISQKHHSDYERCFTDLDEVCLSTTAKPCSTATEKLRICFEYVKKFVLVLWTWNNFQTSFRSIKCSQIQL